MKGGGLEYYFRYISFDLKYIDLLQYVYFYFFIDDLFCDRSFCIDYRKYEYR